MLANALRLLNTGNAAAATPLLLEFTRALMRHLYVEDEVLTPFFGAGHGSDEAAAMMVREHAEIAAQLELIENCLREADGGRKTRARIALFCQARLPSMSTARSRIFFPAGGRNWRGAAEGAALLERVRVLLAE